MPVLIVDQNQGAQSFMHFQVKEPYITLDSEIYISLHSQELSMCKRIGYEFYCELFVVKHKSKCSCESAIYFNLGADIIKEHCNFLYYFNKTNIKP